MRIAIIGGSNAIISGSYAHVLKDEFGEDLDIYALGACSSIIAVYFLLKENIVDNYDYVLFECNVNDCQNICEGTLSPSMFISFLSFISSKFKTHSIPVFIILPPPGVRTFTISEYTYKSVAYLFGIDILDFSIELYPYSTYCLGNGEDRSHFCSYFQQIIAQKIKTYLRQNHHNYVRSLNLRIPEFTLLPLDYLSQTIYKTSIITASCGRFSYTDIIHLPQDKYLAGISYVNPNSDIALYYFHDKFKLVKNLRLKWPGKLMIRPIGYSLYLSSGGHLRFTSKQNDAMFEASYGGYRLSDNFRNSPQLNVLLESLILCDSNPMKFGGDLLRSLKIECNSTVLKPIFPIEKMCQRFWEALGGAIIFSDEWHNLIYSISLEFFNDLQIFRPFWVNEQIICQVKSVLSLFDTGKFTGHIDTLEHKVLRGWAKNIYSRDPVAIDIFLNGNKIVDNFRADVFRDDLLVPENSRPHGFVVKLECELNETYNLLSINNVKNSQIIAFRFFASSDRLVNVPFRCFNQQINNC